VLQLITTCVVDGDATLLFFVLKSLKRMVMSRGYKGPGDFVSWTNKLSNII
jgi:hypothetical protein